MSIRNDMLSHTAPPRERHQSTVTRELPLGRQRRAEPRPKNSEQSNPTPKADTALVEPSPQPRIHSGLYVEVQHSDVTLRAENQSLKKVLEALAHKSGIQINAQLIVDRPLSIQLVRVPLDRALQTILEFEDSFLAFESRGQANVALKAVWVVPAGTGGKWPPQTSACARELSEIEQQLASAHSSQRAEAIETLIDLQGPDAAQAVVQSLRDQDDDVRYRALQKAYVAGLALPPEVLAGLVQHDNSELVRMMAVEAIGAHPSINEQDKMAFARYAISDGSPAVQTRASELLSHLESAPLMREYEELLYDEATQETFAEFPEENIGERGE
jgi:hypothetical protein